MRSRGVERVRLNSFASILASVVCFVDGLLVQTSGGPPAGFFTYVEIHVRGVQAGPLDPRKLNPNSTTLTTTKRGIPLVLIVDFLACLEGVKGEDSYLILKCQDATELPHAL